LDEVQILKVQERVAYYAELEDRRATILKSIEEQGKLTDELRRQIEAAETMTELEDLYLPYRPKRRTRATIAIEKGYEPVADAIMHGQWDNWDNEALAGARDIIAERVSEDAAVRNRVRNVFRRKAVLSSSLARGVDPDDERVGKFESWIDWKEPIQRAQSHRILALFRGEEAGVLKVHVKPDSDEDAIMACLPACSGNLENRGNRLNQISKDFHSHGKANLGTQEKSNDNFQDFQDLAKREIKKATEDSYKRLIGPSIETEFRNQLKEKADREAIRVFAENLRQLLLAAPMGQKRTLAIDPGFRTGCKVVCLDAQGQLLHNETIYPFTSVREERAAISKLEAMVEAFHIEAIAIGNGTAGRETEEVVAKCRFRPLRSKSRKDEESKSGDGFSTLRPLDSLTPIVVSVSEAGASVYSASDVARREFPDYDVTVRGAVSIGRRLMDPLSELVKIDPKSIGVGQYQHDVDQKMLAESLADTVVSCVNSVGVELNTASRELLSYVSGIGPALADKIVEHRNRNGAFASRQELLNVKGLGSKAFEQCAGFLRIRESANPLDHSAVHPERYALVEKMAASVGADVQALCKDAQCRASVKLQDFVTDDCGMPTLQDIMKDLEKPGLDPRAKFEVFEFDKSVTRIEDVKEGMVLPGIVTNITAFGAFVDIGVHQDGLVHISQMANRRVNDPTEVVHLQQHLQVKVLEVDLRRHRISLSLKL
ncbi:MAG: RNA-binding transcriptional accessory protein, partial [Bacteroidales bacterium]|nr:RNA-binding transcriptional accessory protein [Bacteroidales bacterium]